MGVLANDARLHLTPRQGTESQTTASFMVRSTVTIHAPSGDGNYVAEVLPEDVEVTTHAPLGDGNIA